MYKKKKARWKNRKIKKRNRTKITLSFFKLILGLSEKYKIELLSLLVIRNINLLAHNSYTSIRFLIIDWHIDILLILLCRAQLDCCQQHSNKYNTRNHQHIRIHIVNHLNN